MASKNINIYGPRGCGKTHLANILQKKINSIILDSRMKLAIRIL